MILDDASGMDFLQVGVTLLVALVVMPLRAEIKRLADSDDKLREEIRQESGRIDARVTALQVELAKNYPPRSEVVKIFSEINVKLDKLMQRMDEKADK